VKIYQERDRTVAVLYLVTSEEDLDTALEACTKGWNRKKKKHFWFVPKAVEGVYPYTKQFSSIKMAQRKSIHLRKQKLRELHCASLVAPQVAARCCDQVSNYNQHDVRHY
jgi:hypothetical protein